MMMRINGRNKSMSMYWHIPCFLCSENFTWFGFNNWNHMGSNSQWWCRFWWSAITMNVAAIWMFPIIIWISVHFRQSLFLEINKFKFFWPFSHLLNLNFFSHSSANIF
jgi:hypothetical protein